MTFMMLSAFSFALHYFALYKEAFKVHFDPEFRFFLTFVLLIFLIALLISLFTSDSSSPSFEIIFSYGFDDFHNWLFNRRNI